MRPDYDVCVSEESRDPEGKPFWTKVGAAWVKESGAISVQLRPKLSVSDSFMLFTPKEG